jgi:acyl dehydratase
MSTNDAWSQTVNGKPKVGDVAETTLAITPEVTRIFAEISGDNNPVHFDLEVAKRSIFKELIGHGAMTIACLNGVMARELPGPGCVMMHSDWKFLNPTRVGETITGRIEVIEVRDDKPMCKVKTTVTRPDGKVCLEGTVQCYVSPM